MDITIGKTEVGNALPDPSLDHTTHTHLEINITKGLYTTERVVSVRYIDPPILLARSIDDMSL